MLLGSPSDVVRYLIDRGFLQSSCVVGETLEIREITRRNRSYKVEIGGGQCLFVKQAIEAASLDTIANEAYIYTLFDAQERWLPKGSVPTLMHYDPSDGILVFDTARSAESLAHHVASSRRFPVLAARFGGRTLGLLHLRTPLRMQGAARLGKHWPWVYSILPAPSIKLLYSSSAATAEIVRIVQFDTELCASIEEQRRAWLCTSLIHGDLRWDNCVLTGRMPGGRRTRVMLVDWELAGLGDPAWDVASMFAEHLLAWLASAPLTSGSSPSEAAKFARYALTTAQRTALQTWMEYCRACALERFDAEMRLKRAIDYVATVLIQRTLESAQKQAEITPHAVIALQMASNIIRQPDEAAVQLLGLSC